jgi:phosphotransferase family enzyme
VPEAGSAQLGLRLREPAGSVDELVASASSRQPFHNRDGKSGSRFERVVIDGERYVLKLLHVDDDWIARSLGDLGCRALLVWTSGLLDAVPSRIDHTVVGAAAGLGRHGWGAALLMHDVGEHLVPEGDEPIPIAQHAGFLDGLAQLSGRFWGWRDELGLLPHTTRLSFFGPGMLEVERERGWPDPVPRLAGRGWRRFAERAPADVGDLVTGLRREPWLLAEALRDTPTTLLHGDWKLGNLGTRPDGRTILLDWAYPGEGPVCHDLAWYLALNRARLPETKEATIARFRHALHDRGVPTNGWWERQLGLSLLGALVQFGWEKALGDEDELGWWVDAARHGSQWL